MTLNTETSTLSPTEKILQLSRGFEISQCIFVAAKLGIADLLKDGPKHCDYLATETKSNSNALYRLLRVLTSVEIFLENEPQHFQLTPAAACLIDNQPGSIRNFILLRAEQDYACWEDLIYSVHTGKNAFEHQHGMNRYKYNKQHPELATLFDKSMLELAAMQNDAILTAYDFSTVKKLVDIGGGQGSFLVEFMRRYPANTGVLFDQEHAIKQAEFLLKEVMERCELITGNFFESIPKIAGTYLLKHVLHNWDEQKALKILQNCRQAMEINNRILVIEGITSAKSSLKSRLVDMRQLVMLSAGQLRTEDEIRKLFQTAGFELVKNIPTATEISIIEGIAI